MSNTVHTYGMTCTKVNEAVTECLPNHPPFWASLLVIVAIGGVLLGCRLAIDWVLRRIK